MMRGESSAEPRRRTVTKSAASAAALLLTGVAGAAPAQAADGFTMRLPAPTGPHRTGSAVLHLVDRSRRDPWNGQVRELMTTVIYPARQVRGYPVAPQMTAAAAEVFMQLDAVHLHPELPESGVNWAATKTHSHHGAPAERVRRRRPVLLYTPGGGDPRTLGTALAEELASHGAVVVTIDHPGETSEVELPGDAGEEPYIRWTELRGDPTTDPELFRTMIETRVADVRFVLDQLEVLASGGNPDAAGRALPRHLGDGLDLHRVGCYGHSAGGTAAAQAMHEDRRIAAAVNLEGYLNQVPAGPGEQGELLPVAEEGTDRPLLLLGTDGFRDQRFDDSWSAAIDHSGSCVHRREIADAMHWVFTDYAAMAPQLQTAGLMTPEERAKLVGTLAPTASVRTVRDQVRSFFMEHLSGRRPAKAPVD